MSIQDPKRKSYSLSQEIEDISNPTIENLIQLGLVIAEIKEIYSKIGSKLDILKKTTSKEFVKSLQSKIPEDLDMLDKVSAILEERNIHELKDIKEKMLLLYDSSIQDQRDIDLLYEKENILRGSKSLGSDPSPNSNFHPSSKLPLRDSAEFFKMKQRITNGVLSSSGKKPTNSEVGSQSRRNSQKFSSSPSRIDTSSEIFNITKGDCTSPIESLSPQIKPNKSQRISTEYIEKLWTKFVRIGSLDATNMMPLRADSSEPKKMFSSVEELREFTRVSSNSKNIHLWRYISYFQERFISEITNLRQKLFKVTEELHSKDQFIKKLLKKQSKLDVYEEASYINNLKLISNPKDIISKIKQLRQQPTSTLHSKMPSWSSNSDRESINPDFNVPILTQLQNLNTSNNGLMNISTNQSINYLNTELNVNCNFIDIGSSLNSQIANNWAKPNPSNNAQIKVLEETIQYLKENNTLLQAENDKLKEAVNYLNKKIDILEE